ncbi:hypothetical protein GCM10011512_05160 [Tersicoccus solisilvae]|uniref:Uncharacterized protein n=1 Tax=Tersicoccus solisilvae TaxID=1882339 RepID=A0ABQ1NRY1_9MICC|nr:hypothetical protein [Tersicoccus solisilvae]GGC81449.1 hypothetical protein GCM10011512_05160 [Tersicoccus solisilvae]
MTRRILGFAAAVALAVGGVAAGSVASAAPASAGTCTTWQYKVERTAGLYRGGIGGTVPVKLNTKAYAGYYFNTDDPTKYYFGPERSTRALWGNVYDRNKDRVATGVFILTDNLDYVTCW